MDELQKIKVILIPLLTNNLIIKILRLKVKLIWNNKF